MIPTHRLTDGKIREIRIVQLGSLSQYNFAEPHRHDYNELFFFNAGRGKHEIDFSIFDVEPGTVHLVSAGRIHHLKRDLNSHGFVIFFHSSVFENDPVISQFLFNLDCYDVNEHQPVYKFDKTIKKIISNTIKSLWQYYESDHPYKHHFILNQLGLICLHCLTVSEQENKDTAKGHELYIKFRQHLHHNFKTIRKVKDYSAFLGVTPRKLNEIVMLRTGMTVRTIIQKQLILEARRRLKSGTSSREIAFELGFEDPAHFSKFFKNQTGQTPSQFQKNSL